MIDRLSNLTSQFLSTSSLAPPSVQARQLAAVDPVEAASTQLKALGVNVDLSQKAHDAAATNLLIDDSNLLGVTIVPMKQIQSATDVPQATRPDSNDATVRELYQQTTPLIEDVNVQQAAQKLIPHLEGQSNVLGVMTKQDSALLNHLHNMRAAAQDYLKVVGKLKNVLEQKRELSRYIPFGLETYLYRHDRLEDTVAQMSARGASMIKDVDEQEAYLKRMGLLEDPLLKEGKVLAQAAHTMDQTQ